MSIKDFAAALGVSGPRISKYEEAGRLPERHVKRVLAIGKKAGKRILLAWFEDVPFTDGVPR